MLRIPTPAKGTKVRIEQRDLEGALTQLREYEQGHSSLTRYFDTPAKAIRHFFFGGYGAPDTVTWEQVGNKLTIIIKDKLLSAEILAPVRSAQMMNDRI